MNRHRYSLKRPKGWLQEVSPDGIVERDTGQCVHCGGHWIVSPVVRQRPWCNKCNGPTCFKEACVSECVPFEEWLDKTEKAEAEWRPPAPSETTPRILVP